MPGPLLAAAPYVLQGVSLLGGLFGRKKKKYMDPETLRRLYGPNAIARDTTELSNYILNSPYGQQLMASAAEQGQTLQSEMASRAAASGLSPDTGGQSATSDFATSAAAGAQSGLERQTRAGITQAAMPIASQFNAALMGAGLEQQGAQNLEPGWGERIGAAAGQTASMLPAPAPKPKPGPTTSTQNVRPAAAAAPAFQQIVQPTYAGTGDPRFRRGLTRGPRKREDF